ncbi:MAG: Sodium/glycine symporter GlyP [Candidatus Ozemobacter sibiricus]|jgi:AGCS family alanine or glycine:cation symporter|uniref:Sodium/glycine symporter GlyP n=1 Tax=Candidatus Ozemobacter sibiricus TaxID=2268124 RepID=A0A367ZKG2_9BACT|nr:MAG: Sodium/glycine symporter GlyP [Candidatus Ozemobacter sibiricus]
MADLERILDLISGYVWGAPLLILLFGTHLFLTVRLRFIQRYLGQAIRLSLQRSKEGEGDISQFGALTTALAATIGTGNIVGVATAVAAGGPGAILWMWLTGVFGISTKYAEALLAVKYRVTTPDGQMAGGPMYVLERGLHQRWLGWLFALLTAVAAFGIGNMVQANSIAAMLHETFGLAHWVSGLVMALLTAVVVLGGIKWISRACEALVPFMACAYVAGCLYLLLMHLDRIPASLALIVTGAFSGTAMTGGFLGAGVAQAIRFGIARGLFSNESGLGSAPIVAAAAQTRNPVRQALVSSTGTFWDTVVVCAMTGLVIVNSQSWTLSSLPMKGLAPELRATVEASPAFQHGGLDFDKAPPDLRTALLAGGAWPTVTVLPASFPPALREAAIAAGALRDDTLTVASLPVELVADLGQAEGWRPPPQEGSVLTRTAFADIPVVGPLVLSLGLLTFVFSTILGWEYYGEKAAEYLLGSRVILPYRLLWVVSVLIGSMVTLKAVWTFADIANGLMAVPNLITLLALNHVILAETRTYLWEGRLDEA